MSLLVERFLIRNNYTDFNKKDVSFQLQTHPQNPSFKAITDTLDYFGIENVAANVPENSLSSMPVDFLTLINQDREELVLATKKDDFVYVSNAEGQKEKYTTSDFNKIWGKKIIAIEKTAKASSAKTLKALGVSVILALLVSVLHFKEATLLQSVILLLSSIGVYLSYLLVKEKVGYYSPTVHSICTSSAKSNCDEVINSKGGMLTRNISLADASFLYFAILVSQNIFFISSNINKEVILLLY